MHYRALGQNPIPRPVARLLVWDPTSEEEPLTQLEIDALIDTGADVTCILISDAVTLGLVPVGYQEFITAAGQLVTLTRYLARIQIPPAPAKTLLVYGTPGSDALVGRDYLQYLSICFDGLNGTWTIPCS